MKLVFPADVNGSHYPSQVKKKLPSRGPESLKCQANRCPAHFEISAREKNLFFSFWDEEQPSVDRWQMVLCLLTPLLLLWLLLLLLLGTRTQQVCNYKSNKDPDSSKTTTLKGGFAVCVRKTERVCVCESVCVRERESGGKRVKNWLTCKYSWFPLPNRALCWDLFYGERECMPNALFMCLTASADCY